jgi:excisionase family DNA binding protein
LGFFDPRFSLFQEEKPVPSPNPITREHIKANRNAVTIMEAAEYLGVSHRTIRRLIASGKLAAYRVAGGPIRLQAADVEAVKVPVRYSADLS